MSKQRRPNWSGLMRSEVGLQRVADFRCWIADPRGSILLSDKGDIWSRSVKRDSEGICITGYDGIPFPALDCLLQPWTNYSIFVRFSHGILVGGCRRIIRPLSALIPLQMKSSLENVWIANQDGKFVAQIMGTVFFSWQKSLKFTAGEISLELFFQFGQQKKCCFGHHWRTFLCEEYNLFKEAPQVRFKDDEKRGSWMELPNCRFRL